MNELAFPFLPELHDKARLTQTSLELPESLTFEDWKRVGHGLGKLDQSTQWWIGDWWKHEGHEYGDRKALVESEDWTGPAYQTCRGSAVVAGAFEMFRRRNNLSFEHHKELAAFDPAEADSLLDWCEAPLKNGAKKAKSIRQLHEEIARRMNADLEASAIASVEEFLSEYGDIDPEKFEQAKRVGIEAIKAEIDRCNNRKILPTVVTLSRLLKEAIEAFLGPVRGDLQLYVAFIGPVRDLAELGIDNFELLAMAQSEKLLDKDLFKCAQAIRKIQNFVKAVKEKFNQ